MRKHNTNFWLSDTRLNRVQAKTAVVVPTKAGQMLSVQDCTCPREEWPWVRYRRHCSLENVGPRGWQFGKACWRGGICTGFGEG